MSTGGSIGGQFAGNMANGLLAGMNSSGSASSTTKAAVSEGMFIVLKVEMANIIGMVVPVTRKTR